MPETTAVLEKLKELQGFKNGMPIFPRQLDEVGDNIISQSLQLLRSEDLSTDLLEIAIRAFGYITYASPRKAVELINTIYIRLLESRSNSLNPSLMYTLYSLYLRGKVEERSILFNWEYDRTLLNSLRQESILKKKRGRPARSKVVYQALFVFDVATCTGLPFNLELNRIVLSVLRIWHNNHANYFFALQFNSAKRLSIDMDEKDGWANDFTRNVFGSVESANTSYLNWRSSLMSEIL